MSHSPFAARLKTWGPDAAHGRVVSRDEAFEHCRRLACRHYENFTVVSLLLPRRLRPHFFNVYAWCRWADDLGDEVDDPDESLRLLGWWRDETWQCYNGQPRHPVLIALAESVDIFSLPIQPFLDLISAFEQDQTVHEYATFADLSDYCRRSANPVGRLVLHLLDEVSEASFLDSDSICTGLQLANFWQDVNRDMDIERVYIPKEDRERFGYEDDDLQNRRTTDAFMALMKFEVERARDLLQSGLPLVPRLSLRFQIDIDLFIRGGLRILDRIERIDYRVWKQRPVVTRLDVAQLFFQSVLRTMFGKHKSAAPRSRRSEAVDVRNA